MTHITRVTLVDLDSMINPTTGGRDIVPYDYSALLGLVLPFWLARNFAYSFRKVRSTLSARI